MESLKRVIADFKKLTPEVLKLLIEKYPDGYDDRNNISFRNAHGERMEAVEVLTEDRHQVFRNAQCEARVYNGELRRG